MTGLFFTVVEATVLPPQMSETSMCRYSEAETMMPLSEPHETTMRPKTEAQPTMFLHRGSRTMMFLYSRADETRTFLSTESVTTKTTICRNRRVETAMRPYL
eukprot:TRINITY_DN63952_c0_g1_i1.p2 TRINITY_DN63952_c0_g1~~TRINITY_DN63952_c0_g1_i1.p2  ORF type:complete len:102 (-),score=0.53 TRINITY_DN63952_c0_g1_i1:409-714(-)